MMGTGGESKVMPHAAAAAHLSHARSCFNSDRKHFPRSPPLAKAHEKVLEQASK